MRSWSRLHTSRFYRFSLSLVSPDKKVHNIHVLWEMPNAYSSGPENYWIQDANTQAPINWPEESVGLSVLTYIRTFMANKLRARTDWVPAKLEHETWSLVSNGQISLTRCVYASAQPENLRIQIFVQYSDEPRVYFATTNEEGRGKGGQRVPEEYADELKVLFPIAISYVKAEFSSHQQKRSVKTGYSMNIGVEETATANDGLKGGV